MIRVLHSVSNMDRAGIETMLMNYYRNIDRNTVQFDFLCNKSKPGDYDDEILRLGGRIFKTPGLNPMKYPSYLKYMKGLFQKYPEYRIVHAHNGPLAVYALCAAKRNHVPIRIFHAHNNALGLEWKLPLKLYCKSRIKDYTTNCFTCGIAAGRYYFNHDIIDRNRYVLVTNAIEIEEFCFNSNTRDIIRKQYNLWNKRVVGHVGRFESQKNHDFLIDVFFKLNRTDKNTHLVLVGEGELLDKAKSKCMAMGIENDVTFVGKSNRPSDWYQAFDVFVMPSRREGLPVVGIEAQASDLPCVFSKNISTEVAITNRTWFVGLNESVETWADTIEQALSNKLRQDNREMMKKAGYDIKSEAIKLQEIYIQLANGGMQ